MTAARKAPTGALLTSTAALLVLGVMAVYTASSFASMQDYADGGSYHYLVRHLVRLAAGVVFAAAAYSVPRRAWILAAPVLYGASLLMLVMTVIPGFPMAPAVKGSSRWIFLGPVSLMPAELVRFTMVLFIASLATGSRLRPREGRGFLLLCSLGLVPAGLMLLQPDFAGAAYLTVVMIVVVYLAEARLGHIALLLALLAAVGAAAVLSSDYRRQRLMGFRNPEQNAEGANWQSNQSIIALGSGGLRGRGLGRGRQQMGYLPEPFSDFVLAVVGEELGFVGTSVIMGLLLVLSVSGWRIAQAADSAFGQIAAGGLTASIAMGALIHSGVVTRLLPPTGTPLPMISWGGTNVLVTLASIGFLARIAKEVGS
jgi:cell division protein FtsW